LGAEEDFIFLQNFISYCTSFKAMFSEQNLPNIINAFVEFTPFSLVGTYLIFVSIKMYQTTRHLLQKECCFYSYQHENLKSQTDFIYRVR